ncbi:MAG: hypothetical protein KDE09_10640, partial [Anaerolineales bacterium]|nr:hypothetical protein [Anaerolineales bacterium]
MKSKDEYDFAISLGLQFSDLARKRRRSIEDRLVEFALMEYHNSGPIDIETVKKSVNMILGERAQISSSVSVEYTIAKLVKNGIVIAVKKDDQKFYSYHLTESRFLEIKDEQEWARSKWKSAYFDFFHNDNISLVNYEGPFWDALGEIFTEYADEAIDALRNDKRLSLDEDLLDRIVAAICSESTMVNKITLKEMLTRFLNSKDKSVMHIVFVVAQNQYCLRLLGFDKRGVALKKSMLQGCKIYLDTNIVINLVFENARKHNEACLFVDACIGLGVKVIVTKLTLQEYKNVVSVKKEQFEQLSGLIPRELIENEEFDDDLIEATLNSKYVTTHGIFAQLQNPKSALIKMNIEIEDEHWFETAVDQPDTRHMMILIRNSLKHFQRKSENTLRHDALMIRWIQLELQRGNYNGVYFVTLDNSLLDLNYRKSGISIQSQVISLERILQWISPFAYVNTWSKVVRGFCREFSSQIFPSQDVFVLDDYEAIKGHERAIRNANAEEVRSILKHARVAITNHSGMDRVSKDEFEIEMNEFIQNMFGRKIEQQERIISKVAIYEDVQPANLPISHANSDKVDHDLPPIPDEFRDPVRLIIDRNADLESKDKQNSLIIYSLIFIVGLAINFIIAYKTCGELSVDKLGVIGDISWVFAITWGLIIALVELARGNLGKLY